LQGFGKMWQKTYRARLTGASASPAEVVGVWRERFPELSGFGKGFRVPSGGLAPGAVALLAGLSGVMVLYSDEESFTYMTPEGPLSQAGSRSAPTRKKTALRSLRPTCLYAPTTRSTS
jgi:hypothetical protein